MKLYCFTKNTITATELHSDPLDALMNATGPMVRIASPDNPVFAKDFSDGIDQFLLGVARSIERHWNPPEAVHRALHGGVSERAMGASVAGAVWKYADENGLAHQVKESCALVTQVVLDAKWRDSGFHTIGNILRTAVRIVGNGVEERERTYTASMRNVIQAMLDAAEASI